MASVNSNDLRRSAENVVLGNYITHRQDAKRFSRGLGLFVDHAWPHFMFKG